MSELPIQMSPTDPEPSHGSIVLTQSITGTAWQRHYSDGLWHSTTSHMKRWAEMFEFSPAANGPTDVYLVYATKED